MTAEPSPPAVQLELALEPIDEAMRDLVLDLIESVGGSDVDPDAVIYLTGLRRFAEAGDISWEVADMLANWRKPQ